jgi:phosphate transport system permease protein
MSAADLPACVPPRQPPAAPNAPSARRWFAAVTALVRGIARTAARLFEPVVVGLIHLSGWSAILFVAAIFIFVLHLAWPMLARLDLVEFFTSTRWRPNAAGEPQYGILALVSGTLCVTLLAMAMAVPLGLGAAVYLSEFCTGKLRETLKIVIELLAAVPSVLWGFVGYMVLAPLIMKYTGAPIGINLLNGGIILALMSVPIIVSISEDALKAVPDSYREAALSLGANRWEIVYRVLFPAAKKGLLAAVLLGVGRAIGETMAVLMVAGHAAQIPGSLLDPVRTLTATIAQELGEAHGDHYHVLFAIGVVLFLITFVVNLTADLIVNGVRGRQHE